MSTAHELGMEPAEKRAGLSTWPLHAGLAAGLGLEGQLVISSVEVSPCLRLREWVLEACWLAHRVRF